MFYPRSSKYGARKVEVDGIVFDSAKEARRWGELRLMEKAGEIRGLERQKKYELIPSQYITDAKGKKRCVERAVNYIADFVYTDKNGREHVEDTKGMRTKDYIIKRKLMLYIRQIRIEEI